MLYDRSPHVKSAVINQVQKHAVRKTTYIDVVVFGFLFIDTAEVEGEVGVVIGAVLMLGKLVTYSLKQMFATSNQIILFKKEKKKRVDD